MVPVQILSAYPNLYLVLSAIPKSTYQSDTDLLQPF